MHLFLGGAMLVLILSNVLWKPPDPRYHTIPAQRVAEFLCSAPWLCWTITGWVGFLAWQFVYGDNGSLFFDFFHYGTFAIGLGLAAILSFVYVRKSLVQWVCYVGFSLTMLAIIAGSGYSNMLPSWDGFTADAAAARIASRRPVVASGSIISSSQCSLVLTNNPIYGGPFSSFDRTYLLIGPDQHAVSRITVRPFLPCYWTAKRTDNYAYAEEELQQARTAHELVRVMDKYPRSKVAAIAEERYSRLHRR